MGECQGCPKAPKSFEYSPNCKVLCFYGTAAGNVVPKACQMSQLASCNISDFSAIKLINVVLIKTYRLICDSSQEDRCPLKDEGDFGDAEDDEA